MFVRGKNGLRFCLCYVRGLRTLWSIGDLELDPVILGEALEAVSLDGREVNENVWAVLLLDEPKTLGVVKPLHGTCESFTHCALYSLHFALLLLVATAGLTLLGLSLWLMPYSKGPLGHRRTKKRRASGVLETGV